MVFGDSKLSQKVIAASDKKPEFRFYVGEKGSGVSLRDLENMTKAQKTEARKNSAFFNFNLSTMSAEVSQLDKLINPDSVKVMTGFAGVAVSPIVSAMIDSSVQSGNVGNEDSAAVNKALVHSIVVDATQDGLTVNSTMVLEARARVNICPNSYLETTEKAKCFFRSYRAEGPWTAPISAVYANSLIEADLRDHLLNTIRETCNMYVLSNGGLYGQFKRIENTNGIGRKYRTLFPESGRAGSPEEVAEYISLADKAWQPNKTTIGNGSVQDLYKVLMTSSIDDPYVRVNKVATCGPGYPLDVKRRDCYVSDLMFNNDVLELLAESDEQCDYGKKERPESFEMVVNYFSSVMTVWVKPKFEIMKREKLKSKVRNIYVFPSFAQVTVGKLCTIFNEINDEPLEKGSMSLKGFNPFYSKIDGVINKIKSRRIAFYSDNLYCYDKDKDTLYSLDVEKMESTSTISEGYIFMEYLLSCLGVQNKDANLCEFLRLVGGSFAHDRVGQVNAYTGEVVGLMSGSQTTFLINHFRMARAASIAFANYSRLVEIVRSVVDGEAVPIPLEWKIFFNLEKTCSSASRKSSNLGVCDGMSEYVNFKRAYQEPGTLSNFGAIIKLDLLGFDGTAVQLPIDEKFGAQSGKIILCACLDFERLMKAIMYRKPSLIPKKKNNKDVDELTAAGQGVVTITIQLMTLQALYLTGGYAYPTAHTILQSTFMLQRDNLYSELNKVMKGLDVNSLSENVVLDFLTDVVKSAMVVVSEDLEDSDMDMFQGSAETLAYQILQSAINGEDNEFALKRFMNRRDVITNFHTEYGEKEKRRKALEKMKLKLMPKKGGHSAIASIMSGAVQGGLQKRDKRAPQKRERKPNITVVEPNEDEAAREPAETEERPKTKRRVDIPVNVADAEQDEDVTTFVARVKQVSRKRGDTPSTEREELPRLAGTSGFNF